MSIYMRIMSIVNAEGFQLDEAMLDTVIGKYKVGSILNVPASVAQTPQTWYRIIRRIQEKSMESIGIPCIYGVDQIHGTTYTLGGTFFPQGREHGRHVQPRTHARGCPLSTYETKAGSIPWTYAPVVDLGRDPRWPRMWENYGEDCYLQCRNGTRGRARISGRRPQPCRRQPCRAACMKHYMGWRRSGQRQGPHTVVDNRSGHAREALRALSLKWQRRERSRLWSTRR